jgi:rhodanese-related sulfurtransferase
MLWFVAQNALDATMPQWQAQDLDEARASTLLLDARSPSEYAQGHLDGAFNIPHLELQQRLGELAAVSQGRAVSVYCASGVRSPTSPPVS